ncbi:MAG: hypothetical protein ABR499_00475 [Gemmatimonadaceae bacterium]
MRVRAEKPRYDDSTTLAAARAAFFEHAGLGGDGGYGAAWVRVEAKPFPFSFPNTRGRVAAAKLHDLHHIATEYDTDWTGEAEIGAWEIAGGCGAYGWAWVLNLGAFLVGMVRSPRRLFAAFVTGRRARNLYHSGFPDGRLTEVTVGMLREQLHGSSSPARATRADVAAFMGWCAIAVLWHATLTAAAIAVAVALWSAIRR